MVSHDRPTPAERAAAAAHDPRTCVDCHRISSIDLGGDQAFTEDEVEVMRLQHRVAVLEAKLGEVEARLPREPFDVRCADALADEVDALIRRNVIDQRSPAADALLDYRNPPRTPRSDRLGALEAELAGALASASGWKRDRETQAAGHARTLDAIAAELGLTGLELAENPKAAGRPIAEIREKHDTLKGLLESYKAQWKAHYAGQLEEAKRELDVDFTKRRDDYLEDQVADAREKEREDCAEIAVQLGHPDVAVAIIARGAP